MMSGWDAQMDIFMDHRDQPTTKIKICKNLSLLFGYVNVHLYAKSRSGALPTLQPRLFNGKTHDIRPGIETG